MLVGLVYNFRDTEARKGILVMHFKHHYVKRLIHHHISGVQVGKKKIKEIRWYLNLSTSR